MIWPECASESLDPHHLHLALHSKEKRPQSNSAREVLPRHAWFSSSESECASTIWEGPRHDTAVIMHRAEKSVM